MYGLIQYCQRLWSEDEGQGLAEYALITLFVALAVISALSNLGSAVFDIFNTIAASF